MCHAFLYVSIHPWYLNKMNDLTITDINLPWFAYWMILVPLYSPYGTVGVDLILA